MDAEPNVLMGELYNDVTQQPVGPQEQKSSECIGFHKLITLSSIFQILHEQPSQQRNVIREISRIVTLCTD